MKSLDEAKKIKEQGRAIARGMTEENARKERNEAKEVKRQATMLENAARTLIGGA